MRYLIASIILFSFSIKGYSQNDVTSKALGTYQVQVINMRGKPYIPSKIDSIVLNNRHSRDTTYIKLFRDVRVMILPLSTITRKDFEPIEQTGLTSE